MRLASLTNGVIDACSYPHIQAIYNICTTDVVCTINVSYTYAVFSRGRSTHCQSILPRNACAHVLIVVHCCAMHKICFHVHTNIVYDYVMVLTL